MDVITGHMDPPIDLTTTIDLTIGDLHLITGILVIMVDIIIAMVMDIVNFFNIELTSLPYRNKI